MDDAHPQDMPAHSLSEPAPDMGSLLAGGAGAPALQEVLVTNATPHTPLFFFRLVGHPSRSKRVRSGRSRELKKVDLAVSLHAVKAVDSGSRAMYLDVDPVMHKHGEHSSPICTWMPSRGLAMPQLVQTLHQWTSTDELGYKLLNPYRFACNVNLRCCLCCMCVCQASKFDTDVVALHRAT